MNPTFVGEAKLKRKREDELIGFRAIGDHGRTTLQRMLDVQRKPRTKSKPVQKKISADPVEKAKETNDGQAKEELTSMQKRQKRESSFTSDLLDTSSDEEMTGAIDIPMHVLLSSADGDSPALQIEASASNLNGQLDVPPIPELGCFNDPPLGNEPVGLESDAFDDMPYTPTQVIATAPVNHDHLQDAVTEGDANMQGEVPNAGVNDAIVRKPHRGVRFQSELEVHSTSPVEVEHVNAPQPQANDLATSAQGPSPKPLFDASHEYSINKPHEHGMASLLSSSQRVQTSEGIVDDPLRRSQRIFAKPAPTLFELLRDLDSKRLPHKLYRDPYWSNLSDVPQHAFEYAGRRYTHQGDANRHLQEFKTASSHYRYTKPERIAVTPTLGIRRWEFARAPPTVGQLKTALADVSGNKSGKVLPGMCSLTIAEDLYSTDASQQLQMKSSRRARSVCLTRNGSKDLRFKALHRPIRLVLSMPKPSHPMQ